MVKAPTTPTACPVSFLPQFTNRENEGLIINIFFIALNKIIIDNYPQLRGIMYNYFRIANRLRLLMNMDPNTGEIVMTHGVLT